MAYESHGIKIWWSNDTAKSSASTNLLGEVKTFNIQTGGAAAIDVSHLNSTAKEKLMGLPDEGQWTLGMSFSTSPANARLRSDRLARNRRCLLAKLADPSTTIVYGDAYCLSCPLSGGVDAALTQEVTFEITGKLTWSTA